MEYKSTEGLRSTPTPILRKPSMDFLHFLGALALNIDINSFFTNHFAPVFKSIIFANA